MPTRTRSASARPEALVRGGVPCFAHARQPRLSARCRASASAAAAGCCSDPVVAEIDGERVLLTHGDALCTDDHSYQELRSVVRDPAWQRRFLALPRARRELLADEARAGSRRHTARTVPYIMDVNAAAVTRRLPRRGRAPHDPWPHPPARSASPRGGRRSRRSAWCSAPGTSRAATSAARPAATS